MAVLCTVNIPAADVPPKAPVPKSPYLPIVYRYADTMLERGRDTYGPQKTGLFLSALDRATLSPLTNRPLASAGIRQENRVGNSDAPLVGANPRHDQNLLRLLYTLSELSGKPHYRQAADAELKWFLENARTSRTSLIPLGPHMSWNVMADQPMANEANMRFFRPWMLWDRCFELVPDASKQVALELAQDSIPGRSPRGLAGGEFSRQAGFYIRTWAVAHARTKDGTFIKPIETLLGQLEKQRQSHPQTEGDRGRDSAAGSLSLAIDCDGAAHRVPEPLALRLRELASGEDQAFLSLAPERKATWFRNGAEGVPTAQLGLMCVSRYDNTAKTGYRDLILAAADAYLNSSPSDSDDVWPMTLGHAISLEVAAWRHSANPAYLNSARRLADMAVEKFWGTNALPKASFKMEHYETITGADTLALALVELHLHILHITAVRCPPNTIDR